MADRDAQPAAPLVEVCSRSRVKMVRYAHRLLADAGIPDSRLSAEDVVQQAFAIAFDRQHKAPVAHYEGFLYEVIRNQVRDEGRRKGVSVPLSSLQFSEPQAAEDTDAADDRVVVNAAVNALPLQQQRMIVLTNSLRYTQAEAAQLTEVSPGTVAAHVTRAYRALRGALTAAFGVICVLLGIWELRQAVEAASPHASLRQRILDRLGDSEFLWVLAVLIVLVLTAVVGPLLRTGRRKLETGREIARHRAAVSRRVEAAVQEVSEELGRRPTEAELAARLGMAIEDVREALEAAAEESGVVVAGGTMALIGAVQILHVEQTCPLHGRRKRSVVRGGANWLPMRVEADSASLESAEQAAGEGDGGEAEDGSDGNTRRDAPWR